MITEEGGLGGLVGWLDGCVCGVLKLGFSFVFFSVSFFICMREDEIRREIWFGFGFGFVWGCF